MVHQIRQFKSSVMKWTCMDLSRTANQTYAAFHQQFKCLVTNVICRVFIMSTSCINTQLVCCKMIRLPYCCILYPEFSSVNKFTDKIYYNYRDNEFFLEGLFFVIGTPVDSSNCRFYYARLQIRLTTVHVYKWYLLLNWLFTYLLDRSH